VWQSHNRIRHNEEDENKDVVQNNKPPWLSLENYP